MATASAAAAKTAADAAKAVAAAAQPTLTTLFGTMAAAQRVVTKEDDKCHPALEDVD